MINRSFFAIQHLSCKMDVDKLLNYFAQFSFNFQLNCRHERARLHQIIFTNFYMHWILRSVNSKIVESSLQSGFQLPYIKSCNAHSSTFCKLQFDITHMIILEVNLLLTSVSFFNLFIVIFTIYFCSIETSAVKKFFSQRSLKI